MIYAKDINEHTPWQDLTPGGEIYEPGTARAFNTGTWRTDTPVFHEEACKHYALCSILPGQCDPGEGRKTFGF